VYEHTTCLALWVLPYQHTVEIPWKSDEAQFHLVCMDGLRREFYCLLPLYPTFQKSQKGSILNSHINCSCPVEDPASILYASHIHKACPEGSLLLIWHNDHTVYSGWKQWWSKGLYNSLAVLSIQQVSLNKCPHSELSYSTNSSSETWLVICHFLTIHTFSTYIIVNFSHWWCLSEWRVFDFIVERSPKWDSWSSTHLCQ